ncbi:hypothetical protein B0H14DRAFT_689927 [Mycena olivaceomarginata]|nr:hypothetical protein B0H14DRAFT_689927 [Mycena olivaceomarginata]
MLSASSLCVLLSALSIHVEEPHWDGWQKEAERISYWVCSVLDSADHYFADENVRQVLRQPTVWAIVWCSPLLRQEMYISWCDQLSSQPQWKNIISQDLPRWITYLESFVPMQTQSIELFWFVFGVCPRPMSSEQKQLV